MLGQLPNFNPDPILFLIEQFKADNRTTKVDLGVGVYKTDNGETPIMKCVKAAEKRLLEGQTTKTYLGATGNQEFSNTMSRMVLGEELFETISRRLVPFQAVGGTGSLRLASDLINKASPGGRVWLGEPSWANHPAIFLAAGLTIERYVYCAPMQTELAFQNVLEAARRASRGDVFLIHASCHNPTGVDLNPEQAKALLDVLHERGVTPLVDCAYAGFAAGFEQDLHIVRAVMSRFEEAIVCFSCSKNFGLYRERIGLLMVKSESEEVAARTKLGISSLARQNYSMPPDHGAAVVREILASPELTALWREELEEIRQAIHRKRKRLSARANTAPVLAALERQSGMFSLLPMDRTLVPRLREEFGVYMTADARINVLGVPDGMEDYLVDSLARVTR
jgi:aspartate/tyrosine/aromatic aminotransferase